MKPGYKTSEFILAVLVIIAATTLMLVAKIGPEEWKWAVSSASAGYALSRGIAKKEGG